MRKITFVLLLIATSIYLQAQLAMGKWRTHIAYNATNLITQSDKDIYAVSNGTLFSINKEDESIKVYNKSMGFTDINITWIDYNASKKQLLIAYKNGNIDILSESGVKNIPDLFNKPMSADKNLNHSFFYNNIAYLSCNFGIIALNVDRNEIKDTYYIGPNGSEVNILTTLVVNESIYALTSTAIYSANVNEPNLSNYTFWSTLQNIPGSGDMKKLVEFNGKLMLHRGEKLYQYSKSTGWSELVLGISVQKVFASNTKLLVYKSDTELYSIDKLVNIEPLQNIGSVMQATLDPKTNQWWLAAQTKAVIAVTNNQTAPKTYAPQGPKVNTAWSMTFSGKKLFVIPGGRWGAQYFRAGEIMIFDNEKWTSINTDTIQKVTGYNALDFISLAVNPNDQNHFFVTAYGRGLYEFKNNKFFKWHNTTNSTLETVVPSDPINYTRVEGVQFDKEGNLLVANSESNSAIKVLTKDNKWLQLASSSGKNPMMGSLLISNQNPNQKWINATRTKPGIFIYDDKGTLLDQKDDNSKFYSNFTDTDGNPVAPTYVHCLAQDQNGVIWAGTNQGPLLFFNTSKILEPGYTCTRIKIPRNDGTNLADYLLESEEIKTIAIDGANRKWLGTENSGVFLMSENGQETIQHFNTENSPLLSNNILSININPNSGEVFIGTSLGLISYQSNAANAQEIFQDVHAYPNPVRENFTGLITITGLVSNTNVKITDINGNLIYQTVSNGSLATWDGKNTNGVKVKTGIYLAICANEDGTQSAIAKIMIIN